MEIRKTDETARGWIRGAGAGGALASRLEDEWRDVFQKAQWFDRGAAIDDLYLLMRESHAMAAGGAAIDPISRQAFEAGCRFLRLLSRGYPLPSMLDMEDGSIAFDWDPTPEHSLTVLVLADGTLAYASLHGDVSTHDDVVLGMSVPSEIIDELRRLPTV